MVTIPWPDWVSDANPYAEALRPFYIPALCRFRRNNPWLWQGINQAIAPAVGIGNIGFNDLALDAVCPPLEDAAQPLLGGQCLTQYRVICRTFDENGGPTGADRIDNIAGPITRVETPTEVSGGIETVELLVENAAGTIYGPDPIAAQSEGIISRIVWTIERQDGLPDDCGNQVPWPIPPIPPTFPQPIEIDLPGGQTVTIDVNLPSFDAGDWPDFTFEPVIEVGDIPITITPEGITFPDDIFPPFPDIPLPSVNLPPGGEAQLQIEATINNAVTNSESAIINNIGMQNIKLDCLEDLIKICCGEFDSYELEPVVAGTLGGTFGLPDRTIGLRISGSSIDINKTRTQSGSGAAPTIFYWGWYSISAQSGEPGDRVNLAYNPQVVFAPPHAQSITINPTHGAIATIEAIIVNRPALPNCGE